MIVAGFPQLYALTIWQPWCSAIVQGHKRIVALEDGLDP